MSKAKLRDIYNKSTLWFEIIFLGLSFLIIIISLVIWKDLKTATISLVIVLILAIPSYKRLKSAKTKQNK